MLIGGRRRRDVPAGNRARPDSVLARENWGTFDLENLREPPDQGDGAVTSVPATGGTYAALRFGFEDPTQAIAGNQQFRVRIRCTVTGGSLRAWLYEGGAVKRDLGTVQLSGTAFQLVTFNWSASEVSDSRSVELRLLVYCDRSSGNYELDAVDWLINAAGDELAWPPGWGLRPQLGSHFGVSLLLPDSSYGQQLWNQWIDFFNGRAPDIVCSLGVGPHTTWDELAGGAGTSDTTFSGVLSEAARYFNTNNWPSSKPLVIYLPGVPYSHRNVNNGVWRSPSIWAEIKTGTFDLYYRRLWRRLATRCGQTGRDPRTLVIRWCGENTGNWKPDSIGPDKQSFIDGFRRTVDLLRQEFASVLGQGTGLPLIEFGPTFHLHFGSGPTTERLWNVYPGDDWVDIVGLGIHDHKGMSVQQDWDAMLVKNNYLGTWVEGYRDWFDFGASRNKWLGTSEICSNVNSYGDHPRTQNNHVFWTNGFEPLRQRYDGRFLYFIYMFVAGNSSRTDALVTQPWQSDGWGEPIRQLYRLGGTAGSGSGSGGGGGSGTPTVALIGGYELSGSGNSRSVSNVSVNQDGEVIIFVSTERENSYAQVSSISHPSLSNLTLIGADYYYYQNGGVNFRIRTECWRATATQGSGTLTINFTAKPYLAACHLYHVTNFPGYKARNAQAAAGATSISASATASGAQVGFAVGWGQVGSSSAQLAISPWSDAQSNRPVGTYRRSRVHARVNNDVSGTTQQLTAGGSQIWGHLVVYLF